MEKNHINPQATTQTPFKSIQYVNGAWKVTPWPDVPPLPSEEEDEEEQKEDEVKEGENEMMLK